MQKDIILKKLKKEGKVDNFWAIDNRILRLSDIIFRLKKEGHNIVTDYDGRKGKKNCVYYYIA